LASFLSLVSHSFVAPFYTVVVPLLRSLSLHVLSFVFPFPPHLFLLPLLCPLFPHLSLLCLLDAPSRFRFYFFCFGVDSSASHLYVTAFCIFFVTLPPPAPFPYRFSFLLSDCRFPFSARSPASALGSRLSSWGITDHPPPPSCIWFSPLYRPRPCLFVSSFPPFLSCYYALSACLAEGIRVFGPSWPP